MLHPRASVEIDAPLDTVWSVMLDVASYGEWNPFVVRVDSPTPPRVGDPVVLHVRWADGKGARSPERITVIEEPATDDHGVRRAALAYAYEGRPDRLGLVHSTRYQRVAQRTGGPTTYESVMDLSGLLARLAGPGRITTGFRKHAEALKARAESLAPS